MHIIYFGCLATNLLDCFINTLLCVAMVTMLCVRNTPKIVTFVIGKMKLVSFSLFLDAFPLDPRCPLDNDMSLQTFTTYVKGILGLGGKASI